MITTVKTETGSIYRIEERQDGTWWFSAENIPNPTSARVVGAWQIVRPTPWPPVLGVGLYLLVDPALPKTDPTRVPGGGKVTTPVVEVT